MRRPARLLALALAALAAGATGACSLHPTEGAVVGAAGGAAVGAASSTPFVLAVPAGAFAGAGIVSLIDGYRANRDRCPELRRCVY